MINIQNFLSGGETTLYSRKSSLALKAAAAVVLPLAISMLSACTIAPMHNDHTEHSSKVAATINASPGSSFTSYKADGTTLLLQALLDPSMRNVNVASSTSAVLDSFMSALPSSIKSSGPWSAPADKIAKELQEDSDGVAIAAHNKHDGSACIVLAVGASRTLDAFGEPSKYIDFKNALYVADGGSHDVATTIHELTHCQPNVVMKLENHPLSPYYQSSVRELRSDLAVVLYGASRTGSFQPGLNQVTAYRGETPARPSHETISMLETITHKLNPKSFVGMPVNELIESAVKIVNDLAPETNKELRLGFAKDAWKDRLINRGAVKVSVSEASPVYSGFAGQPVRVDLKEHANRIINRSLDQALSQVDVVRGAKTFTVARVEAFAKGLGVSISEAQAAKAEFLDGNLGHRSATLKGGDILITKTPYNFKDLEVSVQGELNAMVARGAISLENDAEPAQHVASNGGITGAGLNKAFGSAMQALDAGLEKLKEQQSFRPPTSHRGPRHW
ncbi:hypothetical protein ACEN2T_18180 [Pseudomonas sp. W22_MBD1_FP4]|uniref:hypothetical protein n=1 Tax=Pseudomonas sp. W22_MBD1_FP4 TaxID=3240272 RepID=UPI003F9C2CDB